MSVARLCSRERSSINQQPVPSGGETPLSHPECVEWQQIGGGECEWMGPTVWSEGDNVIMPVRGSFPC